MKFSIITTVRHNVGDDFVREGILHLLSEVLGNKRASQDIAFEYIHKHAPVTNVHRFEDIRSLRLSRVLDPISRNIGLANRISEADVLVQSGAPIYWCHPNGSHCADNEWFDPLVRKRFLRDRRGRKFLNLAGGSCQRYHSDGTELTQCPKCTGYIQEFFDACDLTVLRDDLAREMLRLCGRDANVLPCTSIFARDQLGIQPEAGEYIVLNFMENGGHFLFGQSIDREKWRNNFRTLAQIAGKMGKVIVACHNEKELALAREVVPEMDTFLVPDDHVEFMRFYARARFGIVNRVHSAFMMASFGKPAAVVGSDSRARMVSIMGLPSYYVEDVRDVEPIIEEIAALEHRYAETSEQIRDASRKQYLDLISPYLD